CTPLHHSLPSFPTRRSSDLATGPKFLRYMLQLRLSIHNWRDPTCWFLYQKRLIVVVARRIKSVCGGMRARNRYFLRIGLSGITPSVTGGKPANVHTISVHAVKCLFR